MTSSRIKKRGVERRRWDDTLRPELTNRADRIWLIMEPGLKNFVPSEMDLLSDFIVAKLCEYRLNVDLETILTEQERALKETKEKVTYLQLITSHLERNGASAELITGETWISLRALASGR
jgi:hypothetical protein